MTQYYEVLGLSPTQHNIYDIELAYWTLVQKYHPSLNLPESSVAAFYEVTIAFFYINDYEFGRRPSPADIEKYRENANYWATLSWDELLQVPFFKKLINSTQEPTSLKFLGLGIGVFFFLIPILCGYLADNRFIATVLYGCYSVLFLYFFLFQPPVEIISNPFRRWWYVFKTNQTLLSTTLIMLFALSYFQITFRTYEVHALFLKLIILSVFVAYVLLSFLNKFTFIKRAIISVCIVPNLVIIPTTINFITAKPVLEIVPRYTIRKVYTSKGRQSYKDYYLEYWEPNFVYLNNYLAFAFYFDNTEIPKYTHNFITIGEGIFGWKTMLDNEFVYVREEGIVK